MTSHYDDENFKGGIRLSTWKAVLGFARVLRPQFVGIALIGIAIAILDASYPLLTGLAIDAAQQGDSETMWTCAGLYAAAAVVMSLLVLIFVRMMGRVSSHLAAEIRHRCFARLQDLEYAYFDKHATGWLVSRCTSDCDKLARVIAFGFVDFLWAPALMLVVAVLMFNINASLAAVVLCVVPLLALASWFFQTRLLSASRQVRKLNSELTAGYNEGFAAIRTTRSLNRQEQSLQEFAELAGRMKAASIRNALLHAAYLPVILSLGAFGTALALLKGGVDVRNATGLTMGELVAFMLWAAQFFDPMFLLAQSLANLMGAQAAAERVVSLIRREPLIQDSPAVRERMAAQPAALPEHLALDGYAAVIGELRFEHVRFGYSEDAPVLHDFCLRVAPGDSIALVGPTGGGKSTIVSLLCRFYEPLSGRILIDGVDYRDRSLAWYQSQLGVVQQHPHVFTGTIRENIRYGRLDASDEQILEACRLSGADRFIDQLPEGLNALVGPGGSQLSTGQKQLISLARAILADPQVFIMDEATSSVDTATEYLIQRGIEALLGGRISFVIAHRLSTIRRCTRILVIQAGRIVESGSHEELLAAHGAYQRLYTEQFVHDREAELLAGGH